MASKKKIKGLNIWKMILSHNMLPVSEDEFYGFEWHEWLDRINAGFELEKKRIKKLANGANQQYIETLGEDYYQAEEISNNMYAALIVSVWAKVENFLWTLYRYCKYYGLPSIGKKKAKINIGDYAKYFDDNLGIVLQSIKNGKEANFLRIASNAFKHSNGLYHPDGYPVAKMLATKWKISKGHPIKYITLPIKELILGAGAFCATLYKKTEKALK